MGSDLFESYVGSIISAITLAAVAVKKAGIGSNFSETQAAMFPLILAAIGLVASVVAILCVRGGDNNSNPAKALDMATYK